MEAIKEQEDKELVVLGFILDDREYGFDVDDVYEVLRMVEITPVPEAPAFLKGFIDLRGRITSIIDLRSRLGLKPRAYDLSTPIIVVRVNNHYVGLVVESVSEVIRTTLKNVAGLTQDVPLPEKLFKGVLHHKDHLLLLFDLDELVTFEDRKVIKRIHESKK